MNFVWSTVPLPRDQSISFKFSPHYKLQYVILTYLSTSTAYIIKAMLHSPTGPTSWMKISPIEILVTRACEPTLHEPNYALHLEVAEYINQKKANKLSFLFWLAFYIGFFITLFLDLVHEKLQWLSVDWPTTEILTSPFSLLPSSTHSFNLAGILFIFRSPPKNS